MIRKGEIVSSGKVEDLLQNMPKKVKVKVKDGKNIQDIASDLGAEIGTKEFEWYPLFFDSDKRIVAKRLAESDLIDDFVIPEPSLEEYFMQFYSEV